MVRDRLDLALLRGRVARDRRPAHPLSRVPATHRPQRRGRSPRGAAARHAARSELPSVDVFIPTYNEPIEVLEKTITGALCLDYPECQASGCSTTAAAPGSRSSARRRAPAISPARQRARQGRQHQSRADARPTREFVAIFDADFVPQRNFLMRTIGFFDDPQDRHRAGAARLLQSRPDAGQPRAAEVAARRAAAVLRRHHAEPRRLGRRVLLRLEFGDAPRRACRRSAARCRPARSPKTCC